MSASRKKEVTLPDPLPMNLPQTLPLTLLQPDPANVRTEEAGVAQLAASMKLLGCLLPLRVRPHPEEEGCYMVIDGHMRLLAASKAKLGHLPCLVVEARDAGTLLMEQAAANMVRADMTQPDIWAAVAGIVAGGRSIKQAASALGLDARTTLRMERLAQLPPEIMAAIRDPKVDFPGDDMLRLMLLRARSALLEAWEVRKASVLHTGGWWHLEQELRVRRIAVGAAIFEVEAHPEIRWAFDLFSPKDEATTDDVGLFTAAQMKALREKCAWLRDMGVLCEVIEEQPRHYERPKGPAGHRETWPVNHEEGVFGITRYEPGGRRLFWLDPYTFEPCVSAWQPVEAVAGAAGAVAAAAAVPAPAITKDGQKAVETAQRQALGRAFLGATDADDARMVAITLGLLLAERVGCTAGERDALIEAFETRDAHGPLPESLGRIMQRAVEQEGHGSGHAIGAVHGLGHLWAVTPTLRLTLDELAWLKKSELEALANRLRLAAPVNATQKAIRKMIVDDGGVDGQVVLAPDYLPLLGWKPDWPFSMSRDPAREGYGPDVADEDEGDEDGDNPLDDADGAALESAYGPND